jgi:hypothetical protein
MKKAKSFIGRISIKREAAGAFYHYTLSCCYYPGESRYAKVTFGFTAQSGIESPEHTYAMRQSFGPTLDDYDYDRMLSILGKLSKGMKAARVPVAVTGSDGKAYLSNNDVQSFCLAAEKLGFEVRENKSFDWVRTHPAEEAEQVIAALSA